MKLDKCEITWCKVCYIMLTDLAVRFEFRVGNNCLKMRMHGDSSDHTGFMIRKCIVILLIGISPLIMSLVLGLPKVQSFNIDVEYPIVITNSFDGQTSHFGLSVMLLERTTNHMHSEDEDPPTGWVVIGSPKSNSTYPNHTTIYEPGVIWRCAVGRKKIRSDDCKVVVIDPTNEFDPKNFFQSHKDKKDEGWLGGTIFSGDSDRFVSCASRWRNQKYSGNHLVQGICYWLPRSHITLDAYNSSWPWLPPKYSNRLIPLLTKSRLSYCTKPNVNITDCPSQDKVFDWPYGQAGFSVHVPRNHEMILGAPGIFEWTGSVIQYRDAKEPDPLFKRYNSHPSSPAFSEFLVAKLQNEKSGKPDSLEYFNYFGYAVTSGNFFHKNVSSNRTQYAAGAPRASSMSGKVLVFSFRKTNVTNIGELDFLVNSLEGKGNNHTHYGSYFGSVLLSLDITNDGFDELLVGAPLCGADSTTPKSIRTDFENTDNTTISDSSDFLKPSTMLSGDEGCIFVYVSTGYDFMRSPQILCGDNESGSRFGSAITNVGDLNLDGHKDIAVGAPYENEGRGAVYIYHGGPKKLILAQKLLPETVHKGMRGFGYSLSLGIDIDNNHYPDLAVGAYGSNQVVIYRTIPLVNLTGNLTLSIPKLLTNTELFNVTSCIGFKGVSLPEILGILVKITISRESNQEKLISWFDEDTAGASNTSRVHVLTTKQQLLHYKKEGMCINFTAKRIGIIDGLTKPVTIKQDYWLKSYGNAPEPTKPINYEIFKTTEGNPQFIVKNISQPDISEFSNKKEPLPITNRWSTNSVILPIGSICEADGDPSCLANITLNACFKSLQQDYSWREDTTFIIGSLETLILEVDIFNHRETANLPITVEIEWKSPPNIRRMGSDCARIYGEANGDQKYRCSVNKPIKEGRKETIKIDFDMTSLYGGDTADFLEFEIKANTSSLLVNDVQQSFNFQMKPQVEFSLFDNFNEGLLPHDKHNKPVNITHTYEINLKGPSPVYKIQMEYYIPKYVNISGILRELLFVRKPIIIYEVYDGVIECDKINGSFIEDTSQHFENLSGTTDRSYENEENLTKLLDRLGEMASNTFSNQSREHDVLIRSRRSLLTLDSDESDETERIYQIHCGLNSIECMKIVCTATKVKNTTKAVIEFKLRMIAEVAKSFIPDYGIDFIVIISNAVMKMLDRNGNQFGKSANVRFETKLAVQSAPDIPAWILIVAVASGLIIFTLVTLILVKCGFFQRKKRDELAALKVKKEIDDKFGHELKKRYEDVSVTNRYSRMNVTDAYTLRMSDGDYNW